MTMTQTRPAVSVRSERRLPGVAVAASGAALGLVVASFVPVASPLLVAIVYGAVLANLGLLPAATAPGLTWSGRRLLRIGVVLLGLQVSLRDVAGLGAGVIVLVLLVVATGVAVGVRAGRALGLTPTQSLLIASGCSICGAAAVAAVDSTIEADEEEVATAVALVVGFGTLMIGVIPALVGLFGLGDRAGGIWAGASVHEVAQVVAAGGIIGGGALAVAVVIKLARVLLLAPVLLWIGTRGPRTSSDGRRAPLVPLFVAGFCALVVVHTWIPLPAGLLSLAAHTETGLLAAAMCALGCGVRIDMFRRVGFRPVALALIVTLWVTSLGLVGALVLG